MTRIIGFLSRSFPGEYSCLYPEHAARVLLAEHLDQQVKMTANQPQALFETFLRQKLSRKEIMVCVPENPGIVKRSPADADSSTASLIQHFLRRNRCGDIPVANHRDSPHRLHGRADTGQVDGAAETLLARAAVNED